MPTVGLAGASFIARKHFKNDIGANSIGLLPAVGHGAPISALRIDKNNELAADSMKVRMSCIAITDVSQIRPDMCDRRITTAFHFVVDAPIEVPSSGSL